MRMPLVVNTPVPTMLATTSAVAAPGPSRRCAWLMRRQYSTAEDRGRQRLHRGGASRERNYRRAPAGVWATKRCHRSPLAVGFVDELDADAERTFALQIELGDSIHPTVQHAWVSTPSPTGTDNRTTSPTASRTEVCSSIPSSLMVWA